MDIKHLVRGVAYAALAGVLLATAVALNKQRYPTPSASNGDPSPNAVTLDPELARCKALGAEAARDAACKAAWQANRERFLGSHKLYQDRLTDGVSATAVSKRLVSPSGEAQPQSRLQSPLTTDLDAPHAPDGTAGRSQ